MLGHHCTLSLLSKLHRIYDQSKMTILHVSLSEGIKRQGICVFIASSLPDILSSLLFFDLKVNPLNIHFLDFMFLHFSQLVLILLSVLFIPTTLLREIEERERERERRKREREDSRVFTHKECVPRSIGKNKGYATLNRCRITCPLKCQSLMRGNN